MTGENWNTIMYAGMRAQGWIFGIFFVGLIIFGQILFLSLFLSMLLSKFDEVQDEMEQKEAEKLSKSKNEVGTHSLRSLFRAVTTLRNVAETWREAVQEKKADVMVAPEEMATSCCVGWAHGLRNVCEVARCRRLDSSHVLVELYLENETEVGLHRFSQSFPDCTARFAATADLQRRAKPSRGRYTASPFAGMALPGSVFVTPTREPPMPTAVQRGSQRFPKEPIPVPSPVESPESVKDGQMIRASTDEQRNEVIPSDFPPLFHMPKLLVPAMPLVALPAVPGAAWGPFPSHQHAPLRTPPLLNVGPSTYPPVPAPTVAMHSALESRVTHAMHGIQMEKPKVELPTALAVPPRSEAGEGDVPGRSSSDPGKVEETEGLLGPSTRRASTTYGKE
eukprot:symbB.v1.2.032718.t1/scaffold3963.1/size47363/2